jgi:hypothetical protein
VAAQEEMAIIITASPLITKSILFMRTCFYVKFLSKKGLFKEKWSKNEALASINGSS